MKKYQFISVATFLVLNLVNVAKAQNLFVPDYTANSIIEIAPGGGQSTFASGLNHPFGMAFDRTGNLFVSDDSLNIYKFTPDGTRSTFAHYTSYIHGLACDSAGNLYMADFFGGKIIKFAPDGTQSTFATGLAAPNLISFDGAGNLFVADYGNGSITKITAGGVKSTVVSGVSGYVDGVAVDNLGNVFVSVGGYDARIMEYTPGGAQSIFASGLINPAGMQFDAAGNLYVAEAGNGDIYKFTPDGARTTIATLQQPISVAFQPVPEPSALNFKAVVNAVSISTNSAGDLVYHHFGNKDLIRECANQMGVTNLKGLHLVYDLGNDALEVLRGSGTNQTLVCTPLTFSGGVFLGNAKATKSERQAWVYWHGQMTPSGTLTATERYGYDATSQLTQLTLSGQLQFAVPGSGNNKPTIYQGMIEVGGRASLHQD